MRDGQSGPSELGTKPAIEIACQGRWTSGLLSVRASEYRGDSNRTGSHSARGVRDVVRYERRKASAKGTQRLPP
jgi:hypothetical protein